jgi:hypothetical protein
MGALIANKPLKHPDYDYVQVLLHEKASSPRFMLVYTEGLYDARKRGNAARQNARR